MSLADRIPPRVHGHRIPRLTDLLGPRAAAPRASWRLAVLLALLTAASAGPARAEAVRGITLSTHTNGGDWAGEGVPPALKDMRELGANWVAIHPYAGIAADGTVHFRSAAEAVLPEYLARPIREAHAAGLKILVKPHLAYWRSPFSWRGEIRFEDAGARVRFWESYTAWILDLAYACREADGFVVGTELDGMIEDAAPWRALIASVRARTSVPLTYAANWTDFRRVTFWDALDVIGVQAYFPLTDSLTTESAIRAGWARRMDELRTYAAGHHRDVLFTELGYNRSHRAAIEPWAYRTDGPEAEPMQELCLRVALEAIEAEPAVVGAFLWKWFPNPRPVGRNFQLATPRLRETIREVWSGL